MIVVVLLLVRHGWHWDWEQLHLRGMTGSGLRLGLVLALFSFVGFESATTLGSEARNPLKTIPRAVIQSAILAGAFFTVCAYAEVLGFTPPARTWERARLPCTCWLKLPAVRCWGCSLISERLSAYLPAPWPALRRRRACCCCMAQMDSPTTLWVQPTPSIKLPAARW